MHPKILSIIGIFILLFVTTYSLQAQFSTSSGGRIESEFKLNVPYEIKQDVWLFLNQEFDQNGIKNLDTAFNAVVAQEIFYDQYFDNEDLLMYQKKVGVRFRQRFVMDTLAKELLQLKLPLNDTTGVARQEIKFNVYKKIKKNDRLYMHPFWKYVRPKNRDEVNLQLASLGITGDDLSPSVKVRQDRRRIYVSEKGESLLTMTFDEVCSFYFPYPCYTELELELNEVRFTNGDQAERERMENINKKVKEKIMTQFAALQQDQTPKYNKMYLLLKDNMLEKIYSNLMYIIFGIIVAVAIYLFVANTLAQKQKILAHADR